MCRHAKTHSKNTLTFVTCKTLAKIICNVLRPQSSLQKRKRKKKTTFSPIKMKSVGKKQECEAEIDRKPGAVKTVVYITKRGQKIWDKTRTIMYQVWENHFAKFGSKRFCGCQDRRDRRCLVKFLLFAYTQICRKA